MPLIAGLMGATYQYLRTGTGTPQELKDYFHPKTGEQDADGNDLRVDIGSYMKDIQAVRAESGPARSNTKCRRSVRRCSRC